MSTDSSRKPTSHSSAQRTTPPPSLNLMRPPVAEIERYLRQGIRQPDIERILRQKYGRGFRATVRARARILARAAASLAPSVATPAANPVPSVAQRLAENEFATNAEVVANLDVQTAPVTTSNSGSMSHRNPTAGLGAVVDPLRALKEQVAGFEQRKSEVQQNFVLVQRRNKLQDEVAELEQGIQREQRMQLARKMLYSWVDYVNGLRACMKDRPEIESELLSLFAQMGWSGADSTKLNLARLLQEQFRCTQYVASIFPQLARSQGLSLDAYPVTEDFAQDQWNKILSDLREQIQVNELTMWTGIKPAAACSHDGSRLFHSNGSLVTCQSGHRLFYRCPGCGSPLILDCGGLVCYECVQKLIAPLKCNLRIT